MKCYEGRMEYESIEHNKSSVEQNRIEQHKIAAPNNAQQKIKHMIEHNRIK